MQPSYLLAQSSSPCHHPNSRKRCLPCGQLRAAVFRAAWSLLMDEWGREKQGAAAGHGVSAVGWGLVVGGGSRQIKGIIQK